MSGARLSRWSGTESPNTWANLALIFFAVVHGGGGAHELFAARGDIRRGRCSAAFLEVAVAFLVAVSPYYAYQTSDLFGKLIVLVLLLTSVVAWTIIVERWLALRQAREQCQAFLTRYGQSQRTLDLLPNLTGTQSPLAAVAQQGWVALAHLRQRPAERLLADLRANQPLPELTDPELGYLRATTSRQLDTELMRLEERLGLLSTVVSTAPFLGLLGTVWGVMMAFTGMAIQGKADLGAIAPGISGALLTTVVGLLVAIPAVVGYNLLVHQVKLLSVTMDNFTEEWLSVLARLGTGAPPPGTPLTPPVTNATPPPATGTP